MVSLSCFRSLPYFLHRATARNVRGFFSLSLPYLSPLSLFSCIFFSNSYSFPFSSFEDYYRMQSIKLSLKCCFYSTIRGSGFRRKLCQIERFEIARRKLRERKNMVGNSPRNYNYNLWNLIFFDGFTLWNLILFDIVDQKINYNYNYD